MTKNHDDIDQDTTAAEAADSLKAWLASPAQGDTHAEDSEAASGPENTPNEDVPGGLEELQQAYADLQAKLTELEAREAARIEAEEKSHALTAAGIKGDYEQLLTGSKESWGSQIDLLKQFAAENAPTISVPRDPAMDADLEPEEKEITAEDFLKGTHNSL